MKLQENAFSLQGKLILVTGASSGIGRNCAITFSNLGANVVIFGRNQARLDETSYLMSSKVKHLSFTVDLMDYERIENIVGEIARERGRFDGLVNCAGISTTLPLNGISPAKMEYFFQTNVIGGINLTKFVTKFGNFSEKGGSIIFVSSVMALAGEAGKTLYSMTKGALISAVRSMAIELSGRKIRINAISPGVVDTPMSKTAVYSRDEGSFAKIRELHPLGIGQPEDIANACVFLLADASRWITGTNLIVDGGYLAR